MLTFPHADVVDVLDAVFGADSGVDAAPEHGHVRGLLEPLGEAGGHLEVGGAEADSHQERVEAADLLDEELFLPFGGHLQVVVDPALDEEEVGFVAALPEQGCDVAEPPVFDAVGRGEHDPPVGWGIGPGGGHQLLLSSRDRAASDLRRSSAKLLSSRRLRRMGAGRK